MNRFLIVASLLLIQSSFPIPHKIQLVVSSAEKQISEAENKLWHGIMTSNPNDVESALKIFKDLDCTSSLNDTRTSRYGDTPLQSALRVFGKELYNAASGQPAKIPARKIGFAALIGTLGGCLVLYKDNSLAAAYAVGVSLTGFMLWSMRMQKASSAKAAHIVLLLIQADPEINARNKEGLTAIDIHKAYYTYPLQDENWEIIMKALLQKSGLKQDNSAEPNIAIWI
jgi:hypothetical protein